jgi:glycosyltransferase involved in cell wall biosynthesis
VIVGIDASNLRRGGGITHLVELLRACEPADSGFTRVIVWGGTSTLAEIEDRPWLDVRPVVNKGAIRRVLWQMRALPRLARDADCDVLFVPGGSYSGWFRPFVTMSRNLQPFEWSELRRSGWSWMTLRLYLLRLFQTRTLRLADGVIFLTAYARNVVTPVLGRHVPAEMAIIPHGISDRFISAPRAQIPADPGTAQRPFRLLYVSTIDFYKHQWHVVEAVAEVRARGVPVVLELVGPAYPPALRRLLKAIARWDPLGEFVTYTGPQPHASLYAKYAGSDVCVFASSCENMPNILLEGMASGLPIACSNRGPMPEVLGNAGVYFDPESAADIARALCELIDSPELRAQLARRAFDRVRVFSWRRCAHDTFEFLARVARRRHALPAGTSARPQEVP